MDFYQANLGVFVAVNTYLLWSQYSRSASPASSSSSADSAKGLAVLDGDSERLLTEKKSDTSAADAAVAAEARKFQLNFFVPYALAVAADWLQGPHIYAIYKYEKNIPERMVAALYAAGFVSGGISASFAGEYADRLGRKRACLLYCLLYTLTCLTMLSDYLPVLFVGRLCGGVSTTLLFSVFEAWMISDFHDKDLSGSGHHADGGESASSGSGSAGSSAGRLQLSGIFSTMTTLSCVVAIVSGVVGDLLVQASGTRTWPFMAAVVCCVAAGSMIQTNWHENYGSRSSEQTSLHDIKAGVQAILRDPKILSLGITSTVFEGTMYLFIFFWSAALKTARTAALAAAGGGGGEQAELPFGLIFSCFMCTMMAGSAIFTRLNQRSSASLQVAAAGATPTATAASSALTRLSSGVLLTVVLLVSASLSLSVVLQDERVLFWLFCLLEGCIGAYFPAVACLKSEMIDDGIRGRVYSILRFPLNVYVVVAHSLDEEGSRHRNHVFLTCAGLLLVAFLVARKNLQQ